MRTTCIFYDAKMVEQGLCHLAGFPPIRLQLLHPVRSPAVQERGHGNKHLRPTVKKAREKDAVIVLCNLTQLADVLRTVIRVLQEM